jgi:hypothetical protein
MADTAQTLVDQALFEAGIFGAGQTPDAYSNNVVFNHLNWMLDSWNAMGWMMYHNIDVVATATGATSYTFGSGGTFNSPRPNALENGCFARQTVINAPYQVDYPLDIINARENYAKISLKTLSAFPQYVFYDPDYAAGMGQVYIWPVPSNLYEIHLQVKAQLTQFANLATAVSFPPGYRDAIFYSLVRRVRAAWRKPKDPEINELAKSAVNIVKVANAQIPTLQLPRTLISSGVYNIYSDNN